ncbi:hypothetical protein GOBAR_AA20646 [Gossypium barbadense]|uniref:Uncharacterized protein n=1 Tax=Gossypium barbadense TaxID=3634 RepID=A0A2P5X9L8_GOSBA|nr:hypothetical protein GOBAR_AA20646 [Gossypium barbadense]
MEEEHAQNMNPSTLASRKNKSNIWEKKPNLEEMLTKFILVLETCFQNIETALKNQQASIQGLETQIGQLAKLISERPQGELTLRVGDKTITLQARNSSNTSKIEGGCINHSTKTDHVVQPTLQEIILKNLHEPCSRNIKGPIYEERRLQIEELDEWWTQKSRTLDKPKSSQDEFNVAPNQLKVRDKVLLDAADPRIATFEPNEEILVTVLSIFPYGTVEVIHPKFDTFKVNNTHLKPYVDKVDSRDEECKLLAPP